jgi:phage baseplate assembly protein V
MSVDQLLNALKLHMASMDAQVGQARMGVVQSYDPNSGTAKVLIQPEGVLTSWLPVLSQSVGAGWGVHAPLAGGEQVLVLPMEGDAENGVIVGRAWSDQMQPPQNPFGGTLGATQILLLDKGGSALLFDAAGNIRVKNAAGASALIESNGQIALIDASGTSIVLSNNGTVNVTGTLAVSGDIVDRNNAHGSVQTLSAAYNAHVHPGVETGGSDTGTTDDPVP